MDIKATTLVSCLDIRIIDEDDGDDLLGEFLSVTLLVNAKTVVAM